MNIRFLFFLFLSFSIISCNGKAKTPEEKGNLAQDSTTQTETPLPAEGGEITERGLVKEIEDSGYPFAVMTIEFPERKFSEYYTINMEEVKNASADVLPTFIGKYVSFSYTSELTNDLLDLHEGGKSILGMDSPIELPEIKTIEGILQGATQETPGDIPGEMSIKAEDGEVLNFEFFITAEMVNANGKKVKGFYELRTKNDIKSIQLSPK